MKVYINDKEWDKQGYEEILTLSDNKVVTDIVYVGFPPT